MCQWPAVLADRLVYCGDLCTNLKKYHRYQTAPESRVNATVSNPRCSYRVAMNILGTLAYVEIRIVLYATVARHIIGTLEVSSLLLSLDMMID